MADAYLIDQTPARRPPIDHAAALALAGGSLELIQELRYVFLEEAAALFTVLREAIGRGDAPALAAISRSLRGALGVIAARPAEEAVRRLEQTAAAGDLARLWPDWAVVEWEYRRLGEEVEEAIAQTERHLAAAPAS